MPSFSSPARGDDPRLAAGTGRCARAASLALPPHGTERSAWHPGRVSENPNLSAEQVRGALGLVPHPTCGFVAETYRSADRVEPGGLPAPFADGRPIGSALFFLVTPDAPVHPHRIRNDQLYHHYLGDPLEVLAMYEDGTHALEIVGGDIRAGQRLQLFLPGGTFHTARLASEGRWHLGGSTEWPGVEPPDVETADVDALGARFPMLFDFLAGGTI
jgi:predicted cupin superfamily sugar epimerase